jgi:hypothetical protein
MFVLVSEEREKKKVICFFLPTSKKKSTEAWHYMAEVTFLYVCWYK